MTLLGTQDGDISRRSATSGWPGPEFWTNSGARAPVRRGPGGMAQGPDGLGPGEKNECNGFAGAKRREFF